MSYDFLRCGATFCPTSCTGLSVCQHPRHDPMGRNWDRRPAPQPQTDPPPQATIVYVKPADGTTRTDYPARKPDQPSHASRLLKRITEALADALSQASTQPPCQENP